MKQCKLCDKPKPLSEFYKHSKTLSGLQVYCKSCCKDYHKDYHKNYYNTKGKKKMSADYSTNKESILKERAQYRKDNLEKMRQRDAEYYRKNPHKRILKSALSRAARFKRIPKWLSKDDFDKIKQFYIDAEYLTYYTKVEFQVDHIIPLQGKIISGLHVPSNLQLLTSEENTIKSNKF